MKQKIVLHNEHHQRRALEVLKSIPLDPVHEILIRPHKKDRSQEQNSYYWLILSYIGAELGESKEQCAETYKDKFLVQIYERDNQEFSEMIQSLRAVYKSGMKVEAVALRKKIVSLTSTTTATVAQMQEYLTSIDRHAASLGIRLPANEDI